MRPRSLLFILLALMLFPVLDIEGNVVGSDSSTLDMPPSRDFSGGTGLPGDPYIITNITQLQSITDLIAHYALGNDIDATETASWNGGKGFIPLAWENNFMGTLHGRNHTISGLHINDPDRSNAALFYKLDFMAKVQYLNLLDIEIAGKAYVGAVADNNGGLVRNVSVSGRLSGISMTGGIASRNYNEVNNCSFSGNVSTRSSSFTGGICAYNTVRVIDCIVRADLFSPMDYSGGVAGYSSGTISRCQMKGTVAGRTFTGGIAGYNEGLITLCSSSANVSSSTTDVGGLIGINTGPVSDCYSTGSVSGQNLVGGLIGTASGSVRRCYSTGMVTGINYVGGLVGSGYTNPNCFYDNMTSGLTTSPSGTGKSTQDMMKYETFQTAGWDMDNVWNIRPAVTYPFLRVHQYGPYIYPFIMPDAVEDRMYEFDVSTLVNVFDYPGASNAVSFSISTEADWLEISLDGLISGTPTNDDVGTVQLTINAEDADGLTGSRTVQLTVANTNDPPEMTTLPITETLEDEPYSLVLSATDMDPTSDILSFHLDTDAGWLGLETENETVFGTPTNDDVGTYWVNVSVDDENGGQDHLNFTLEVLNVNDRPVITSLPNNNATEDQQYSMLLEGYDIDPTGDVLTFSFVSNADWLSLNGSVLSGTPTNDDVGYWWVNVSLSDGNGRWDEVTFGIDVENVNDPPVIMTENVVTVLQDQLYAVNYSAVDIDPTDDVLIWEQDTDADWVTLDGSLLSGTPTNDDVGKYTVLITVSDGNGGTDSTQFRLEVINVNDPPYWFMVPGNTTTEEGETLLLECLARDVDRDDVIVYSITSDPVSGITVTNLSGVIRWEDPEPGTYLVTLSATDGNATIHHTFTIVVTPFDQPETEEEEETTYEPSLFALICVGVSILIILLVILIVALLMLKAVRTGKTSEEE